MKAFINNLKCRTITQIVLYVVDAVLFLWALIGYSLFIGYAGARPWSFDMKVVIVVFICWMILTAITLVFGIISYVSVIDRKNATLRSYSLFVLLVVAC